MAVPTISAQQTIRVGAPLPLSGPLALEARKQQRGYELWAELVNQAGGIKVGQYKFQVEIIYRDYLSDSNKVREAVELLIEDDYIHYLFAPYGSTAARIASPVAQKHKIPMIAVTASSYQAYGRGHKYIFGIFTPNATLIDPITLLIKQSYPQTQKCALLIRDDLFPKSLAREVRATAKKHNIEIVFDEKYKINEIDHTESLQRLMQSRPDWIFAAGYTNDLVFVRKQMANLGIKVPVLTMIAAPAYQEFIDETGRLAENITSAAWWHPAVRYNGVDVFGRTENFVKRFQQKYKTLPDYVEASAALAGALFQMAIERADSIDGELVRNELARFNETTFFGPVRFGSTGQNESLVPPIFQIQNGKAIVISPKSISKGSLRIGVN